jgi:hypothetical protein
MANEQFKFGETYEKIICKELLLGNPAYLAWLPHLEPDYFTSAPVAYLIRLFKKSYKKTKVFPTFFILRQEIKKDDAPTQDRVERRLQILKDIRRLKYKDADTKYVLTVLAQFIKRQRYIVTISESPTLLRSGKEEDLKKLDVMFKDIVSQGSLTESDLGSWYFNDFKNRLYHQFQSTRRYKLLIAEVDERLRFGGLQKGETILWLAPPATGKTMALIHTTKAWLLQKLKGVYYSFQLLPEDIMERLDASFSGIPSEELRDRVPQIKKKTSELKARFGNSLVIKHFPRNTHSIQSVRQHLRMLKDKGFNADFIVLDYLNVILPENKTSQDSLGSKYYEKGDVTSDMINLCQEEKLLGAAGIQGNRVGAKEDIVTMAHVAESFGVAMEATLILSINRNAQERAAERARIYIAKYTFGKDQVVIPIQTNYDKGSFYRRA